MPGQHDQRTHGHRHSHSPVRLLLRGGGRSPTKPLPSSRPARRSSTGPGNAALERARERTRAQSPSGRRAEQLRQQAPAPAAPAEPDRPPLTDMHDDDLAALYTQAMVDGDETLAEQVLHELDARDEHDTSWGSPQEQAAFLDAMSGHKRQGEREQAKEAYQDFVQAQYLRAVEATRGNLYSHAGRAAAARGEISDTHLFTGGLQRTQMKKYASEELLQFLASPGNQRLTETEFVREWLGKATVADRQSTNRPLGEF